MPIKGFRSLLRLLRGSLYDGDLFTVIKGTQRDYKPKTGRTEEGVQGPVFDTKTHRDGQWVLDSTRLR